MKILISAFALLFSIHTFALDTKPIKKDYLNDESMKIINLEGLNVQNSDGNSTFPYDLTLAKSLSKEALDLILASTGSAPVSGIYEAKKTSFENVFVYVGRAPTVSPTKYLLNVVYVTDDTSVLAVQMDIVKATLKMLVLFDPNAQETFKAFNKNGSFWPNQKNKGELL